MVYTSDHRGLSYIMRVAKRQGAMITPIALLTLVAGLPHCSKAATVFSSFLPGNTYTCCLGNIVSGPIATYNGALLVQNEEGEAFTPSANYYLTRIDVAFYTADPFAIDNDTYGFTLSLDQSSGGAPGATIETWTGLTAPSQSIGTSSLVETVLPVSSVLLLAGNQYWVVASPAASNTFAVWAGNDGAFPGTSTLADGSGSGWSVYNVRSYANVFDVQGTATPEPGSILLVVIGICGLGLYSVRQLRSKSSAA
jgi:hypothetical protein